MADGLDALAVCAVVVTTVVALWAVLVRGWGERAWFALVCSLPIAGLLFAEDRFTEGYALIAVWNLAVLARGFFYDRRRSGTRRSSGRRAR